MSCGGVVGMYCLNCGAYNQDGLKFCTSCGVQLGGSPQQATPTTFTMPVTPDGAPNQIDETTFYQPGGDGMPGGRGYQDMGYTGPQQVVDTTPVAPIVAPQRRGRQVAPFLIGLASSLVVFGIVALLLFVGPLNTEEPPIEEPPIEEPPSEDPVDEGKDEKGEPVDPDDEVEDDDPSTSEIDGQEGPTIRSSLSDYSWEELGQIAELIEACTRSSDALAIAQDYNLVNPSGTYPNNTKTIKMQDGKKVRVELVGVWHDSADTESGKAGLTFLAVDCTYTHRMASGTTTPGGWQGSELRSWLQSDMYANLPDDLAKEIVPAYKMSNNTGKTTTVSSVTQTLDTLWLPSIPEICGPVNWTYTSNPANSSFYNAVFNAEGTQYEAFAQKGIRTEDTNSCLQFGKGWWMRSTAASTGRGRHVSPQGDPSQFGDSNATWGVAFGFCL